MRYLLSLLLCIVGWQIKAQLSVPLPAEGTLEQQVASYLAVAAGQSVIHSGKEESKYVASMLNHPYLYTEEYKTGTLSFDGVLYTDVMLRLNQHTEELIILSPDKRFNVIVPTDRVDYATIGPYYIFYNVPEKGIGTLPRGYYVRLHDGKHPVLKRETCFPQTQIRDKEVEYSFALKNRLYIYKDHVYHSVYSKRSVLKLFKTKKKELKKFIKEHDLNFRGAPDSSVALVTEYYETLIR